jgi:uncharacterized protein YegP (UPF0339 family)
VSYEIYLGTDGFWWWRLYANSGRVIAHATQGHATTRACRHEVDEVKSSAPAMVTEVSMGAPGGGSEAM